jgi:hypothetical protein
MTGSPDRELPQSAVRVGVAHDVHVDLLLPVVLGAEQAHPLHGDLVNHRVDRAARDDIPATVSAAAPCRLGLLGASPAALLALAVVKDGRVLDRFEGNHSPLAGPPRCGGSDQRPARPRPGSLERHGQEERDPARAALDHDAGPGLVPARPRGPGDEPQPPRVRLRAVAPGSAADTGSHQPTGPSQSRTCRRPPARRWRRLSNAVAELIGQVLRHPASGQRVDQRGDDSNARFSSARVCAQNGCRRVSP